MKLRRVNSNDGLIGWSHWCPGCGHAHIFNVEQPTRAYPEFNIVGGVKWTFNGDMERPTFGPSMHISYGGFTSPEGKQIPRKTSCHYYLSNGALQFLSDCEHALAGQTVPLPDFPERTPSVEF